MLTKKHYQKAATIVRDVAAQDRHAATHYASAVRQAFVRLFTGDDTNFNVDRFHAACEPAEGPPIR